MTGATPGQDSVGASRPGGRSARVQAAVYAAMLAELVSVGYARLSIESVAARAGVHKTTVYRRWDGVDALLTEAIRDAASTPVVPSDTGTLRGDLISYATAIADVLAGMPGRVIAAAVSSDAASVAGVQDIKAMIFETRLPLSGGLVARAIARGELPEDTRARDLIDFLVAPLYFRLVISGGPVDARLARVAGEAAAAAAVAGVFSDQPDSTANATRS